MVGSELDVLLNDMTRLTRNQNLYSPTRPRPKGNSGVSLS